ncbi:ABC transporter F family member 4 [Quillaja saponaria]|uniref:ABC transporter F family member 4 n=1 Tax=Quillaja saponaria TaxID=32244 RepID=A0AAD7PXD5_QUISA|nr:ABC transporter F family member 4 [Quillaja saponaria]
MDQVKNRECENVEVKEREHGDDTIQRIMFTAGTVLLIACLKRATVVFFFEQWRACVFLILNLILLAILFMSLSPGLWSGNQESSDPFVKEVKIGKTKKEGQLRYSKAVEGGEEDYEEECRTSGVRIEKSQEEGEEEGEENEGGTHLSKEELNERVEAFIAMFRQHLVSDAKHFYMNSSQRTCLTVEI